MKKVLAIALGMLLFPMTVFAMETLTVDEMASITGQAGVAIAADDIKIFYASSETWYQTTANWVAIDNELRTYHGAVGLVSGAEMFYANAVVSNDLGAKVRAEFYSPGDRPLQVDYTQFQGDFNFGNSGYYGTIVFGAGVYDTLLSIDALFENILADDYGITADPFVTGFGAGNELQIDLVDVGFDSRALTIRVMDELPTFSEAASKRITSLQTAYGIYTAVDALIGANVIEWDPDFENQPRADVLTWAAGDPVKIAGVEIGLPTVELHTESGELNIYIMAARTADPADAGNPILDRIIFDGTNATTANAWSFGTLYYGNDTTFILDGTVEITPLEAYGNPVLSY